MAKKGRQRRRSWSNSDDEREERWDQANARMASLSHKKGGGPNPKENKPKRVKRKDMPLRKRKWLNKRDQLVEEAEEEMFRREKESLEAKGKSLLQVQPDQILYADTPEKADELARILINVVREFGSDYVPVATDTEGNLDVLQIYIRSGGEVYAYVFQLNFITREGKLPPVLTEFLSLPNLIFCGKLVEQEMMAIFRKFNFPPDRLNHTLVIDVLTLVRLCDLFGRRSFEAAVDYCELGVFHVNSDVPEDADRDALENAGIRACANYFLNGVVDKRVKWVHKNHRDWSRRVPNHKSGGKMTGGMLVYCTTDTLIPYDATLKTAEWLDVRPIDLAKLARTDPKAPEPTFFNCVLLDIADGLTSKGRHTQKLKEMNDFLHQHHDQKLIETSVRSRDRHVFYAGNRDDWRRENGYPQAERDFPFKEGILSDMFDRAKREEEEVEEIPVPAGMEVVDSTFTDDEIMVINDSRKAPLKGNSTEIMVIETVINPNPSTPGDLFSGLNQTSPLTTPNVGAAADAPVAAANTPGVAADASGAAADAFGAATDASGAAADAPGAPADASDAAADADALGAAVDASNDAAFASGAASDAPGVAAIAADAATDANDNGGMVVDAAIDAPVDMEEDILTLPTAASPRKPVGHRSRSPIRPPPSPEVPPEWIDDIGVFEDLPLTRALRRAEAIVDREKDDAVGHLIHILRGVSPDKSRTLAIAFTENLPLSVLDAFVVELLHARTIHPSFLHSLSVVNHKHLGGLPIFDQLLQPKDAHSFLPDYLSLIGKADARSFVDFALGLIKMSDLEIRDELRKTPVYPENYADDDASLKRLSISGITDLVIDVCELKELSLPRPFRVFRTQSFFSFLQQQFEEGHVYRQDFIAMIKETLETYDLGAQMVVEHFATKLPEVAGYFATRAKLPQTNFPFGRLAIPFVNQECPPAHFKTEKAVSGTEQCVVTSTSALSKLGDDLASSQFVAVLPHEMPVLMPGPMRTDMLTIRTARRTFHILLIAEPGLSLSAVKLLSEFSAHNVVYTHSPRGMRDFLFKTFAVSIVCYDIKPDVNNALQKRESSIADIARFLYDSTICRRGRVFSAQTKPSRQSLWHRDITASLIFIFAEKEIHPRRRQVAMAEQLTSEIVLSSGEEEEEAEILQRQQIEEREKKHDERRRLQEQLRKDEEEAVQARQHANERRRQIEEQQRQIEEEARLVLEEQRAAEESERDIMTRRRRFEEEEWEGGRREEADRYSEMVEVRSRSRSGRRVEKTPERRVEKTPQSRSSKSASRGRDHRTRDRR